MFRNERASVNDILWILWGERGARRGTGQFHSPGSGRCNDKSVDRAKSLWAGRRQEGRAESSGDGSSRVGRHRPGYKSPLAPCRRRHTSLALWTVRNSLVARVPPVKSVPPSRYRRRSTGIVATACHRLTSDFNPPSQFGSNGLSAST